MDECLDPPGRGIRNTTLHEGHVRPEQVLGREDAYCVDRIVLTRRKTKDEQQSSWARQRQKKPGRSPVKRPKKWTGI